MNMNAGREARQPLTRRGPWPAGLAFCLLFWPAAPAHAWTDDPLTAGSTLIRKVHIDELRTAISNKRADFGFSAPSWTDSTITAGTTLIRKIHVDELRDKCDDITAAYNSICSGVVPATPVWGGITAGVTPTSATHISQLRSVVDSIGTCAACCAQTCKAGTCNGATCNNLAVDSEGNEGGGAACATCLDCDGSGSCVNVGNTLEDVNCTAACTQCNGAGACVNIANFSDDTVGTTCSASCTECNGSGACVNVSSARGGAQWPEGSPACAVCSDCGDDTGACATLTTTEDVGCTGVCTSCVTGTCTNRAADDTTEGCGTACQDCVAGACSNVTENEDGTCTGVCTSCVTGACTNRAADDTTEGCGTNCQDCSGGSC
ncbi:MAG: hypothetical protein HY403_08850, partial [Elusimicrobia bacterium]|nr:hypothetical protein [Elusimicrobiota bacterium]